ncbi:heterokaryon incompatibility protein-domain-containing protein [Hypomontagnella monticulosa]|nr:heterokaryon incompatibility protein-domain-containing protein [Hypomontagnella monticulosa]
MPYTYKELEEGEFRVARLLPGDNAVQVELSKENLDEASAEKQDDSTKSYDALSWQWGSEGDAGGNTIYIRNKGDKFFQLMLVMPNLLWALKSIRQLTESRRLWVDFICINQTDSKERAKQVARMTDIYSGAETVHVWLGKPGYPVHAGGQDDFTEEELGIAVQHIDTLSNLDDANHIGSVDIGIRNKAVLHNLEPLFKLLKRGWFSRRWIEVGVAQKATVHCGDKEFSWEKLIHAVALLERIGRDGSIDRLFKLRPDTRHVSEYVGNISALPAYRLVQNVSGLYRQLSGKNRVAQYTLEQLVCFLVIFQSSEPRDIIYAMLGIASDVQPSYEETSSGQSPSGIQTGHEPSKFLVRYEEDILSVYIRFLEHAMKTSRSLDILCRPWAPVVTKEALEATNESQEKNKEPQAGAGGTPVETETTAEKALPSWILDVTRKPFRATTGGKMVRYNADPFVGPAVRGKFYTASGSLTQKFRENNWPQIDRSSKSITVDGFELGRATKILDLAVHGSIPPSWLSCGGWKNAKQLPPQELWRTLVADRTSAGLDPEPAYPSIIQSAVLEKGVEYGINTNEFIHEKDNSAYHEVFRRVQAVVWNRKLIRAKLLDKYGPGEPLGLVPAGTREDDLIYIVDGCSVPLVLRRKGPANGDSNAGYKLIGECYVNGMMDGRAMKGEVKWDPIKIL